MNKWCYACEGVRMKCAMDYKDREKRKREALSCCHLLSGKAKDTCPFYLTKKN